MGGDFTFKMLGRGNPKSYKTYNSEDRGELAFLQWVKIKRVKLKPWWIILDSGSMVNTFCSSNLLTKIKKVGK